MSKRKGEWKFPERIGREKESYVNDEKSSERVEKLWRNQIKLHEKNLELKWEREKKDWKSEVSSGNKRKIQNLIHRETQTWIKNWIILWNKPVKENGTSEEAIKLPNRQSGRDYKRKK